MKSFIWSNPEAIKLVVNWKNGNGVTIFRHDIIVNFFDIVLFLLSSLVTGSGSMATSSLVLDLWQFLFIRDCPEIRKLEIPSPEFCPISGDWGEFWISNLVQSFLIQCYWMQQNARVTAGKINRGRLHPHRHTQIRVKDVLT